MDRSASQPASVTQPSSSKRQDGFGLGFDLLACLAWAVGPLWWLPQAALLALGVARLQDGAGFDGMFWPAAGIVLAGAARAWLEAWSTARMFEGARTRLTQWRTQSVAALAARSPLDRARIPAGAAASALAEQAEAILPWLTRYRAAMWRVRVTPLLILLPVAWYSWAAAAVLLLAAPMIPLFMAIVGWRAQAASEAQWLQMSSMNGFLLDRLRGLPTLRALGSVDASARRLRASAEDLRERTMRVLRIAFLSSAVLELFAALGVAMVAAYVGFHLLGHFNFGAWGQRLSLAEGLFILLLAPAFFEPLRELAAVWHDRAAGMAAMDALEQLGADGLPLPDALAPAFPVESASDTAAAGPPAVKVAGLAFAFPQAPAVFRDFDLQVQPGEHVALVGGSGMGKSVLMALLAGLLAPTAGAVEIGGVQLAAPTARALRRRMAWMGQRPHVFFGSVQHNVALGRAGVGRAQARQAIQWARLGRVAQAHPGVSLGEGGAGLSGGESARLALARLAAAASADLLLLDEPTAHLDSATAEEVMDALLALARGRTMIVATHDPLLAARMDRVVHLDWVEGLEAALEDAPEDASSKPAANDREVA